MLLRLRQPRSHGWSLRPVPEAQPVDQLRALRSEATVQENQT
jgi:hypothetical protein